jgi:hypothetical protein
MPKLQRGGRFLSYYLAAPGHRPRRHRHPSPRPRMHRMVHLHGVESCMASFATCPRGRPGSRKVRRGGGAEARRRGAEATNHSPTCPALQTVSALQRLPGLRRRLPISAFRHPLSRPDGCLRACPIVCCTSVNVFSYAHEMYDLLDWSCRRLEGSVPHTQVLPHRGVSLSLSQTQVLFGGGASRWRPGSWSRSAASPLCRTHARLPLTGFLSLSQTQVLKDLYTLA